MIDRSSHANRNVLQRQIAADPLLAIDDQSLPLRRKPDPLQHIQQPYCAQQRRHHVFHHHVSPVAQVQRRHDHSVEHRECVEDHKIVGPAGQRDDPRDQRIVHLHRLDGIGRRGQQMQAAAVRDRQLADHRDIQTVAFVGQIGQRRFGLQVQQRRGDAHLERGVDQQHAARMPPGQTHGDVDGQRGFAHAAFVANERDDAPESSVRRLKTSLHAVGQAVDQRAQLGGRDRSAKEVAHPRSQGFDQHAAL